MSEHRRAIGDYYRFSVFNVISFTFLAGNIVILYALRFEASTVVVGLIAASYQVNLLFTLLGRQIVPRLGAVRTFGYAWITRYIFMLPVLLTQLPAVRARPAVVLAIIVLCAYGFNVAKGIGITGTKPTVGEIAPGNQLGKVISTHHLIINVGGIVTGIIIAVVLGAESPLGRYGVLLAVGVVAGFLAAYFILRLPEPKAAATGFSAPFLTGIRVAWRSRPFLKFAAAVFTAGVGVAMVHAFLIVFFKQVYGHSDGSVVFFAVCGSAGGSVMALFSRSVADRIGAKTLFFLFSTLIVAVAVVVAIAPPAAGAARYVYPAVVFFFFTMGQFGIFTSTEVYFYAITDAQHRLDLGIVAGLAKGVAGLGGSFLGGVVLSRLQSPYEPGAPTPFSVYFLIAALVMAVAMVQVFRLSNAGSPTMREALAMLVSHRRTGSE